METFELDNNGPVKPYQQPEGGASITDEVLDPADATAQNIRELLDNAYIKAEFGNGDDVVLTEGIRIWVRPKADGTRVTLQVGFYLSDTYSLTEKLTYANHINDQFPTVRAHIPKDENKILYLENFIPVDGGITKRAFIYAVKSFVREIHSIVDGDTDDFIV